MKVSEVDFGSYEYVRIAVLRRIGPEYCAAHAENYVKRTYESSCRCRRTAA